MSRALLGKPWHVWFQPDHLGLYKTKLVLCIGKSGHSVAPKVSCLMEFQIYSGKWSQIRFFINRKKPCSRTKHNAVVILKTMTLIVSLGFI